MPAFRQIFPLAMLVLLMQSLTGCKKEREAQPAPPDIIGFSILNENATVSLDSRSRRVSVRLPDNVRDASQLVAEFKLSAEGRAAVNGTTQVSGTTTNNFEQDLVYEVSTANGSSSNQWKVTATNNDFSKKWGLGNILKIEAASDKNYEWYMDQGITGFFSSVNCGPTSVTMGVKWADESFTGVPEDARTAYFEGGGWWYNTDITGYLNDQDIPNATIALGSSADLSWQRIKRQLDQGRVMILILDMDRVAFEASGNDFVRVGKFYHTSPGWGHCIVLKGYKDIDRSHFIEAYDPYSLGQGYFLDDFTLKGKNRYYSATDIFSATVNWWNYAIVIAPKGETIDASTLRLAPGSGSIPKSPRPFRDR